MRLRDRLGVSAERQRQVVWLMEVSLVGMLFIGLDRGNVGIVVNCAVALAVTQVPPILERDFEIPMDAGLTLWLTGAVFLHALGTVGLPGPVVAVLQDLGLAVPDGSFYKNTGWWDHMTHALSASVVAAAGYAVARAVDVHDESVRLPPRFMFAFILLLTVAFGVFWEVIEFTVGELAVALGSDSVLTQYGLRDTMLDLVFDTVGAVLVATWGTAYLSDVVDALATRGEDGRRRRP